MLQYPHVFRKLRAEMDRVVGTERLPDFGDRESLPYLELSEKHTDGMFQYPLAFLIIP